MAAPAAPPVPAPDPERVLALAEFLHRSLALEPAEQEALILEKLISDLDEADQLFQAKACRDVEDTVHTTYEALASVLLLSPMFVFSPSYYVKEVWWKHFMTTRPKQLASDILDEYSGTRAEVLRQRLHEILAHFRNCYGLPGATEPWRSKGSSVEYGRLLAEFRADTVSKQLQNVVGSVLEVKEGEEALEQMNHHFSQMAMQQLQQVHAAAAAAAPASPASPEPGVGSKRKKVDLGVFCECGIDTKGSQCCKPGSCKCSGGKREDGTRIEPRPCTDRCHGGLNKRTGKVYDEADSGLRKKADDIFQHKCQNKPPAAASAASPMLHPLTPPPLYGASDEYALPQLPQSAQAAAAAIRVELSPMLQHQAPPAAGFGSDLDDCPTLLSPTQPEPMHDG